MRRFIIYYRRGRNRWRQLQPGVHGDLCARQEVARAIRYLRDDPSVAGVAVRVGDDLFNLMAADASDCYEFTFPEGLDAASLPPRENTRQDAGRQPEAGP